MSNTLSLVGHGVFVIVLIGYLGRQMLPSPKPKIIAIDLGTTYSCVGYYQPPCREGNPVHLLKVQKNRYCIPSVVAFNGTETFVGFNALESGLPAEHLFYDSKRFLGKEFTKDNFDSESKNYAFALTLHQPTGLVSFLLVNGTLLDPVKVSSLIAEELVKVATRRLGHKPRGVVLAVPADFNDSQRNESKRAIEMLGLKVVRLINEPTAAALAYGLDEFSQSHDVDQHNHYVLVLDVGGGTTDCSLLRQEHGLFITQAMAGKQRLGGQDFNENIVKYWRSLKMDRPDFAALAEECKITLSVREKWEPPNIDRRLWLNRSKFDQLNNHLFNDILKILTTVMEAVNLVPEDVRRIVLVGGSSRIPKIKTIVRDVFSADKICDSIDPDLTVVRGVCMQAGILGNGWPLKVSATEVTHTARRIDL